jgi:hypothetical protein
MIQLVVMLHCSGWQIFVMGPIVVMVRRPSLHIPVPPEDVQDEAGFIQTIARISSFQSELAGTAVLQGDPPQWVVQVGLLKTDVLCLFLCSYTNMASRDVSEDYRSCSQECC